MRRFGPLVALALLSAPALADKNAEAIKLLDEGFELFKKGDPQSLMNARGNFEQARALFPEKANPYRLLGMTDARLGHCDQAVPELDQFLKLTKPDDTRIIEATTIRDQCKDRMGALAVDSTPPGAEVRLDRADAPPVGVTPWRSETLPVGTHAVFVTKEGMAPWSQTVQVDHARPAQVAAALVSKDAVVAAPPPREGGLSGPKRKYVIIGGVAVAAVVVAAVVAGVAVAASSHPATPYETATRLPAVMGQ